MRPIWTRERNQRKGSVLALDSTSVGTPFPSSPPCGWGHAGTSQTRSRCGCLPLPGAACTSSLLVRCCSGGGPQQGVGAGSPVRTAGALGHAVPHVCPRGVCGQCPGGARENRLPVLPGRPPCGPRQELCCPHSSQNTELSLAVPSVRL